MACQYAETVAVAERVVGKAVGGAVALGLDEVVVDYPGAAAIILRCRVEPVPGDGPERVIVKQSNSESQHLFREWANLEFLNAIPEAHSIVPTLYGGDEEQQLLVMEDVGRADDQLIGRILDGDDPARATGALIAFQRALGRLHAATIGRQAEFAQVSVRRDAETTSRHVVHELTELLEAFPELLAGERLNVSRELRREIDEYVDELRDPGPFFAFTHGDAAIGNALYRDDGSVRLIDFETGDYRHAMVDGAFSSMRYLFSIWALHLPRPRQRRLLDAYRLELVRGCPEACDSERFNRALMAGSAAWLAAIASHLPRVVDGDVKLGRATHRQRITAALEHFVSLARQTGRDGALSASAAGLRDRLLERWGPAECEMRVYPAFAEVAETV